MKSREYLSLVGRSKIVKQNSDFQHPKTVRPFVDIFEFKGFEFIIADEGGWATTLHPVLTLDNGVKVSCPAYVMLYDEMTDLQIEQLIEKTQKTFALINEEFVNNTLWVVPQYFIDAYADAGNFEKVKTLTALRNQRLVESEKRQQEREELKRLEDERKAIEALEFQKAEQERLLGLASKIKDGDDLDISSNDLVAVCEVIGMEIPIRTKGFMYQNLVKMNFGKGSYQVRKQSKEAASKLFYNIKSYIGTHYAN